MYEVLESDIFENETNYFFCLLGPRFDLAANLMAESLEKRFSKKFKAIFVYTASPNQFFTKENFIVLNNQAEIIEESAHDKIIYMPEFEDLNLEFSQSPRIKEIANLLIKKQDTVFVYAFTSSFLELEHSTWTLIGPDPRIVKKYDNKVEQYCLFKELDLPRNKANIFSSPKEIEELIHSTVPCYITASYASGGNESGIVYSPNMLNKIISGMRTANKQDRFLVSEIFENVKVAPNASAIVIDENKTHVLVISDQILTGTRYLGNVYPSEINEQVSKQIQEIMISIGNKLSCEGYRGFFGCDFLLNEEGRLSTIDLNPRRQGGYLCNLLALKEMGVNLIELELDCVLSGKTSINFKYEDIRFKKAWAHGKVKPNAAGLRLHGALKENTPDGVFSCELPQSYTATFYEPGAMLLDGYVGYVISTGLDRTRALQEFKIQNERILAEVLYTLSTGSEASEVLAKIKETSGKDFRGADLREVDLRRIPLSGSNLLKEANLGGVILADKDLSNTNLSGAILKGANLEGTNLSGANLENAILQGSTLYGANLKGANLKGANLRGCNLANTDFSYADLSQATLQESTIRGANFKKAILSSVQLSQVDLRGAKLEDAILNKANLNGTFLEETHLAGVDFSDALLIGCSLAYVDLSTCNFENANLSRADLSGCKLDKARFQNAILSSTRLEKSSLKFVNFSNAILDYAVLNQSDLECANLEAAILNGASLKSCKLKGANFKNTSLIRTDFSLADLATACYLEAINLQYAYFENTSLAKTSSLSLIFSGAYHLTKPSKRKIDQFASFFSASNTFNRSLQKESREPSTH